MRLDGVHVEPCYNAAAAVFHAEFKGASVLAPGNESERFSAGSVYRLSHGPSRETYDVIIVAKHETTVGTCLTLKLWNPN